jgi:hypothetical protein
VASEQMEGVHLTFIGQLFSSGSRAATVRGSSGE